MNKNPLECTKLSSRGTKSSLNFISTLIHDPGRKTPKSKQIINYSKVLKPSFTKFANSLCNNDLKAKNLTFTENHLKLTKNTSEVLEKIRSLSDDYNLSPFMKVRQEYLNNKQRILVEKRAKELDFQEKIRVLEEKRKILTEKASQKCRKSGKIDEFQQIDLEEYLKKFSRNKKMFNDQETVENLMKIVKDMKNSEKTNKNQALDKVFSKNLKNTSEGLISSLCKKILKEIETSKKILEKTFQVSQQRLETLKKVESFKTFDTRTSLNSVYY
jgi:hypothetical protein